MKTRISYRLVMFTIAITMAFGLCGCGGGGGSVGGSGESGSGALADNAPFTSTATVPTTAGAFTLSGKIAIPQRNDMGVITDIVRITVVGSTGPETWEVPVTEGGMYTLTVATHASAGTYNYAVELMRFLLGGTARSTISTVSGSVELKQSVVTPNNNMPPSSAATVTASAPRQYSANYAILLGTLYNHGGKPWRLYHEYTVAGGSAQKTSETTLVSGSPEPFIYGRYVEFDYEDQGKEVHHRFHAINPDGGELTADVTFTLKTRQQIADEEALDTLTYAQTVQKNLALVLVASGGSRHVLVKEELNMHRAMMVIALDYVEDIGSYGPSASTTVQQAIQEFLKPASDSTLAKVEQYFDAALSDEIENPHQSVLPEGFLDYCSVLDNQQYPGNDEGGGMGKVYGLEHGAQVVKTTLAGLLADVPRPEKWDGNVEAAARRRLSSSAAVSPSVSATTVTTEGTIFERELFLSMVQKTYDDAYNIQQGLDNNAGSQMVRVFVAMSFSSIQMEKDEWLTWKLSIGSAAPYLKDTDLRDLKYMQAYIGNALARARTSDSSSVCWLRGKATELWARSIVYARMYSGLGEPPVPNVSKFFEDLETKRVKTTK